MDRHSIGHANRETGENSNYRMARKTKYSVRIVQEGSCLWRRYLFFLCFCSVVPRTHAREKDGSFLPLGFGFRIIGGARRKDMVVAIVIGAEKKLSFPQNN